MSTDTVSKHDTAWAIISCEGHENEIKIPRNIVQGLFTTIVWNNEFNEETLSGKGTTHVANCIIIHSGHPELTELSEKAPVSKKKRTIKVPETKTLPFTNTEKGTFLLQGERTQISNI